MTSLRQRMTEDMQVRNLALNTQASYVQQVRVFARNFDKSPELLGPEDIRTYQIYLTKRKNGPWLRNHRRRRFAISARSLSKRSGGFEDVIPAPTKPRDLPGSHEPGGGPPLSVPRGQHQTSGDPDDLLRRRPPDLRSHLLDAHRYPQ